MASNHDCFMQCTCGKITFPNGLWRSKVDRRKKFVIEKVLNIQDS